MKIGCPTEIKPQEFRVGMTPAAAAEAVAHGHQVLIQSGAGLGSGFPDDDYRAAGATILPDAQALFDQAEMIVKVKEPQAAERAMLRKGQLLFTYLHLAPDPDQTRDLLASGVIIHAAASVRVGLLAEVEPGVELTGPCEIYGHSRILRGASVASHCVIRDSVVSNGAQIRSFSHLEGAHVGDDALVGPYARLRPGAVLESQSHVGNFVELKKARLGRGAKANHLSYLGDADIGAGSNIGAGTITCNYDGKNKHVTKIGQRAFIGSNTALVAPVSVGDDALVGAGSVITIDVPAGELGIARGKQKNLPRRKN